MSFAADYTADLLRLLGVAPGDPDFASKEAAATTALESALALVESYLDRKLDYLAGELEAFGPGVTSRVLLRRYPVDAIAEVIVAGQAIPAAGYTADREAGILYVWGWYSGWPPSSVEYAGGYRKDTAPTWPLDLLTVLLELAASLWPSIYETGLPSPAADAAAVKRITLPDAGTIEFADQASATGGSAAAVVGYGQIPAGYIPTLDRYRAASIIGGA